MSLIEVYDQAVCKKLIVNDSLQRQVLDQMQLVTDEFERSSTFFWKRWFPTYIKGFYIYGSVGAGKTFLVDLFYNHLPERKKARFHFHHFMQQVDTQLRQFQGKKDPLKSIAKKMAKSIRILCFDEFLVNDVAQAMILVELLPCLFAEKITLIISSNTLPENLYANGVQRSRFLPVIHALNNRCTLIRLVEPIDYRVGRKSFDCGYLHPINTTNQEKMLNQFEQINVSSSIVINGFITIQNRTIPFLKCANRSIWFDFNELCNLPRSQLDYLEIAESFDTIFLSNVPALTKNHLSQTILFVYLIDVLYDNRVLLIINAQVPILELYGEGEMREAFKRTLSRLQEMQSSDYFSRNQRRLLSSL